jgi:hypothetical protein
MSSSTTTTHAAGDDVLINQQPVAEPDGPAEPGVRLGGLDTHWFEGALRMGHCGACAPIRTPCSTFSMSGPNSQVRPPAVCLSLVSASAAQCAHILLTVSVSVPSKLQADPEQLLFPAVMPPFSV